MGLYDDINGYKNSSASINPKQEIKEALEYHKNQNRISASSKSKEQEKELEFDHIYGIPHDEYVNKLDLTKEHIVAVAASLPKSPKILLNAGWEDISHLEQKKSGHILLREKSTGLIIRFDKGVHNVPGYKGRDHYHIYNPATETNRDLFLDTEGNPVPKSSAKSHILPKGDK